MPRTRRSALAMIQSANDRNSDTTTTMTNTMAVVVNGAEHAYRSAQPAE